ncbi:ArsR/SmtB family transcription factor [Chloroflexota bacterium]
MTTIEDQAALFGVLADPTRLKLLKLLSQQQETNALCVNALAFKLGVTQPAVSQHLKVLKDAGLVQGEKRGYRAHYFVKQEALDKAQKLVSQLLEFGEDERVENSQGKSESEIK